MAAVAVMVRARVVYKGVFLALRVVLSVSGFPEQERIGNEGGSFRLWTLRGRGCQ